MKNILRYIWRRSGLKAIYQDFKLARLVREWKGLNKFIANTRVDKNPTVIFINPPDPILITASRGDEAMLEAIVSFYRHKNPNVSFVLATANENGDEAVRKLGFTPCHTIGKKLSLPKDIKAILQHKPSLFITMGADVMDGSYDPIFSGYRFILADVMARLGIASLITGFSFSKAPARSLKEILNNFSKDVVINLRDPVSFQRFQNFSTAKASLVSDVAFLLPPNTQSASCQRISSWIQTQRKNNNKVIGINIHPLLLELKDRHQIGALVSQFAEIMASFSADKKVSLLFLEHDFRGASADANCFTPLAKELEKKGNVPFFWPNDVQLSAAELKQICTELDAVISGRMHLMIASLGVGTPVFGISYKDKMEGLMQHFGLDQACLCSAKDIMKTSQNALEKISSFFDRQQDIRQTISQALPSVIALSEANLSEVN